MSYTRCVGEHVQLVDILVPRSKALRDLVGRIGSQRELVEEAPDRSRDCKERTGIGLFWRAIGAFGRHCGGLKSKVAKVQVRKSKSVQVPSSKQFRRAKPEQEGIALPNDGQVPSSPHLFSDFFSFLLGNSRNLRSIAYSNHIDTVSCCLFFISWCWCDHISPGLSRFTVEETKPPLRSV